MVRGALRRIAGGALALALLASVSPALAHATGSHVASADAARACSTGGIDLAGSLAGGGGLRGRQALTALGTTSAVARAAAINGLSTTRFTEIMRTDPSSRLDRCGRLLYVEPTVAAAPAAPPIHGALSVAGDAFTLNSRPGAQRTIYLDFDGYTLLTDAWSAYFSVAVGRVLPPYDSDGNAASFSATELNAIKEIWLAVSEDYAPFDVNVTTQYPGADALNRTTWSDPTYGAHAVITSDAAMGTTCGCGGIAYIGTMYAYGAEQAYYQPALVFSSKLGNGYAKYVAEATTHEVGHNYGLYHDGNATSSYYAGQGAWAPIMGVGYYKPLVQWSKGEYTGANNTEDDTAIIAENSPLAPDDHSGASASATALTFGAATSGVIESPSDADWFSFTTAAGGRVGVSVQPQSYAPNLDSELSVYDSAGALLSTSNPAVPTTFSSTFSTTGMASSLSFPYLAPGTYFARVTGSGQGSPTGTGYSNYSSLGRYDITATETAATPFAITTTSLPAGTVGTAYSQTLAASGGLGNAASWSLVSGALPDGITLSSSGVLAGTAADGGEFSFVVRATEATTGLADSRSLTLSMRALAIDDSALPGGEVGVPYATTLTSTGGTGAVTWSVVAGALPGGVTLTSGGELAGTPTTAGEFAFTVRAVDSVSGSAVRAVTVAVERGIPVISSAPSSTGITYGQSLSSSVLSGGVASVPGAFSWTTADTAPDVGTASQSVTFTPTDSVNYRPVTTTVPVTVDRAVPVVTQPPTASSITVGQSLAVSTLLGGAATVPGTFTWSSPATVPPPGSSEQSVTFTPSDTTRYTTVSTTVSVTAGTRLAPSITTAPTAGGITYGQTLSSSVLSGGVASVDGVFAWTEPSTVPGAGTESFSVTFTPADSVNYRPVVTTVSVSVDRATPSITLPPSAAAMTYGQSLSSSVLSGGTASVDGAFAWTVPSTVPAAGTASFSVTFTPADSVNYRSTTTTVPVTVDRAIPSITTKPSSTGIIYGQALSWSVLSGGAASVDGAFAWTVPSTVPGAGTASYSVTFTPADSGNYLSVTAMVPVTIDRASPSVSTLPSASAITYGQSLAASALSGGGASTGGSFAWTLPGLRPDAGTASQAVTFTATDAVNYRSVTVIVPVTVDRATPSVTSEPTASSITYGQALTASVLSGGVASVDGTFSWTAADTAPDVGTASQSVTFTPTDSVNYRPVTALVPVTVDQATPLIRSLPASTAVYSTQSLASSALIGGAGSVPGRFTWATPTTIAPEGTSEQPVLFVPNDTARYATVAAQVSVTVLAGRPTTVVYTGAQVVSASARLLLAATRTGPSACAAPRYALDRNPLTGAAGSYALVPVNGSVATTRWLEGAYRISVSYGGSGNCGVSTDLSTLAVSTAGTVAYGGGRYSMSGAGRVDMAFTVRRSSTGAFTGGLALVNQRAWRLTASVSSYARSGGTAVVRGTGRLDRWDRTLNSGRGAWTLASASVTYRAVATRATSTTRGSFGLAITGFSPGAQQPALPVSAPVALSRGAVRIA